MGALYDKIKTKSGSATTTGTSTGGSLYERIKNKQAGVGKTEFDTRPFEQRLNPPKPVPTAPRPESVSSYSKIAPKNFGLGEAPKAVFGIPSRTPSVSVGTTAQSTAQDTVANPISVTKGVLEGTKAVGRFAQEIPRGIAGTAAQGAAYAAGVPQENVSLDPTKMGPLGTALLGKDKIEPAKEGSALLALIPGVSDETAKKFGPGAYALLTISDFLTGPGKKKAAIETVKTLNDVKGARRFLKEAGIADDVITELKLDVKAVAAKTDAQAEAIFREAIEATGKKTPVPKSTGKVEEVDTEFADPVTRFSIEPGKTVLTPDQAANISKTSVFHGTGGDSALKILKDGKILAKRSNLDSAGEKVVSLSRNKNASASYGDIVFEFDNSKFKSLKDAPAGVVKGDTFDGFEVRAYEDIPLSSIKKVHIIADSRQGDMFGLDFPVTQLGRQGRDTVVNQIGTYRDIVEAYKNAGIDVVIHSPKKTPQLPALPKLPQETIRALEKPQVDNTINEAIMTRYKDSVSRTPVENSKLAKAALTKSKDGTMQLSSEILTPISSRLGRFSTELKSGLREYESLALQRIKRDTNAVEPLLRKMMALPPEDFKLLDIAMKNGDMEVVGALAKRHGITDDIDEFRLVWDDLFQRAKEVGMEINYRKNAFPRLIKNPDGYMAYLRGKEDWNTINQLIRAEADKRGLFVNQLSNEEKAEIVNNFVRGYGDKTVLSAPSPTKARTIEVLDENLNQFYEDTPTAIVNYITRMNDEIEGRRFFGKNLEAFDANTDLESNVGALILKGLASGDIKPGQVDEISNIIRSRFKRGKMNGGLQTYRNAELVSTMGSITSAVTQGTDIVWTLFENGWYQSGKAALGTKKITREMLGIDNHIMYEFNEKGFGKQMVDGVFKYTGMNRIIKFFQDTFLTAKLGKWESLAKTDEAALRDDLLSVILPNRVDDAVDAIKNGTVNEDLKIALTGKLLDYQPLTKSEFPQKYLDLPNGRIFWMLKSFTLKQYDIFRTKAIDDITKGAQTGDVKLAAKGAKNLIYLSVLFMAANATGDEVKDLLMNRDTPLSDRLVDNLWRLIGASKFDVYQAKEQGVGMALVKKILPPVSIADSVGRDVINTVTDKEYEKGPLKGDDYKLESTQRIPIVGKPYYWWFGRGDQKEEYKEGGTSSTGGGLPSLPPLPKLPSLPSLPSL